MLEIRGDRIAMIFQDPGKALNPALSIRSQVAEVFYQHRSEDILEPLGGEARPVSSAAPPVSRRTASSDSCSSSLRGGPRQKS